MTPTYFWPSTSSCTEVTRADFPAKKMSCASARRLGRSRTRLPAATRTPFTNTASRSGRTAVSASGSHQSTPSGISGIRPACGFAQDAVQLLHRLRRHRITPIDELGSQRVGGPCLRLLLVGHRHHPKREDFVDLGRVEECALALFGDLGMVVQDDRRDQQQIAFAWSPGEHREAAVPGAAGYRIRRGVGRLEKGDEFSANDFADDVGADQRRGDRCFLVRWQRDRCCGPSR